jgi:hypothetical protein
VVRDVALILACLCMVASTVAVIALGLAVGNALSKVGAGTDTPIPLPSYSCDPTWEVC